MDASHLTTDKIMCEGNRIALAPIVGALLNYKLKGASKLGLLINKGIIRNDIIERRRYINSARKTRCVKPKYVVPIIHVIARKKNLNMKKLQNFIQRIQCLMDFEDDNDNDDNDNDDNDEEDYLGGSDESDEEESVELPPAPRAPLLPPPIPSAVTNMIAGIKKNAEEAEHKVKRLKMIQKFAAEAGGDEEIVKALFKIANDEKAETLAINTLVGFKN